MSRHRLLLYLFHFWGDVDGWETIEMQEHLKESFFGKKLNTYVLTGVVSIVGNDWTFLLVGGVV